MTDTLSARNLTFGYAGQPEVITDWTATFAPGTVTALVGASGRGKSTLLYLLGLMLRPASGVIAVNDRPMSTLSDAERARVRAEKFGFVFQDAALDATRTVFDNVTETAVYRGEDRRQWSVRARQLLDQFEVGVPAHRLPGQVSGGQAQRIALCRALLHDPTIILADEPTGNLDPTSAELVVDAFRVRAARGSTVVVVTHSPDVANRCDRTLRLS